MALQVYWSDRLECLADKMFDGWASSPAAGPFARACIVVGDMATRLWLQNRFLLHRPHGPRRILANIDFRLLPEFANGWLSAVVQPGNGARRRPADHPYSRGVLAWRLDAMLQSCAGEPEFRALAAYLRADGSDAAVRRRFDLATRLAALYDDYLASRPAMLAKWERGDLPRGDTRWQAQLYRRLAEEDARTYSRDYAKALSGEISPDAAFAGGFPRYSAVHVFDIPVAPLPFLSMLQRLSLSVPVTFWTFNPSREYWLDDPTARDARRDFAARLRCALERGDEPPSAPAEMFASPDLKLLGSLASGARGVLSAELDMCEGDCEWVGWDESRTFASLRALRPEVHVCHSPRRELEAARDALHRFFAEVPSARPSDALVLYADASYAPLVESVFQSQGDGALPVEVDGGVREESALVHSFGELLDFRTNRFEASKVFSLLGVPEIRRRFGIDADGLSVLRDMARGSNIRWGCDDGDVCAALGEAEREDCPAPAPFTWRRGLDRFLLDALLGPLEDHRGPVDAGLLGRLQPCGEVESERARLVGRLAAFVASLASLRRFLRRRHSPEEWRDRLLQTLDAFYDIGEDSLAAFASMRRAVASVADAAANARAICASPQAEGIHGEAMCRAVKDAVAGVDRVVSPGCDAVRFAPLKNASAVPARFVWICGLNDGAFPRMEYRPSFDIVGRSPTIHDVQPRERDCLAFLKAALGARERLAFSYVGRDAKSNESMPSAVPLAAFLEWCKAEGVETVTFDHPLQAYSPRYFTAGAPNGGGAPLPPSFSAVNREAAAALAGRRAAEAAGLGRPDAADGGADDAAGISAFDFPPDGEAEIALEDLISFCTRPARFLASKRLGLSLSRPSFGALNDDDALEPETAPSFRAELFLGGRTKADFPLEAERMVEEGFAPDVRQASNALEELLDMEAIAEFRSRTIDFARSDPDRADFACPGEPLAARYLEWRGGRTEPFSVPLEVEGRKVVLHGSRIPPVGLVSVSGRVQAHAFEFGGERFFESGKRAAWLRHLARQASGQTCVTVLLCIEEKTPKTLRPLSPEDACARLAEIVRLAAKPMPLDLQDAWKDETLPDGLAAAMDCTEFLRYKGRRARKEVGKK